MFLTNRNGSILSSQNQFQNIPPPSNLRNSTNFINMNIIPRSITSVAQPVPSSSDETPPIKKMLWGEPTWLFMHTFSEKIKNDSFSKHRREILTILYSLCCNLPCPDCASHAKEHLNKINFNAIQTKLQLKTALYQFHNMVNLKKGFPLFDWDNFDAKYSKANLIPIVNNFIRFYTNRTGSYRMIADDFHRKQIVINLKQWMSKNIEAFDI